MTSGKKLDPRSKFVVVLCLSSLGVLIQEIYPLLLVFIFTVLISSLLGSSLLSAARKMKRLVTVLVFLSFLQSIFAPSGTIFLAVWNLPIITSGGLIKGVMMALRMAIILVSAVIISTSTSREIIQGFVQWKIPYEIAFMVSIGVRFLPLLTEEIRDTLTAIQLRGVELKKIPVRRRLKIYSCIFMPIVLGTIIKSQELSTAMEMRAFRAYPKRTSYMVLKMKPYDYAVIFTSIILCAAVLTLYYLGINPGGIR